jgi:dihydrofolate reductase
LFLPFVDQMIISEVTGDYEGDKYFPEWEKENYELTSTEKHDEFTVKIYDRI